MGASTPWRQVGGLPLPPSTKGPWLILSMLVFDPNRDVPVSSQRGDTAQLAGMIRHSLAWRALGWLIEVRDLAKRIEGSGQWK